MISTIESKDTNRVIALIYHHERASFFKITKLEREIAEIEAEKKILSTRLMECKKKLIAFKTPLDNAIGKIAARITSKGTERVRIQKLTTYSDKTYYAIKINKHGSDSTARNKYKTIELGIHSAWQLENITSSEVEQGKD